MVSESLSGSFWQYIYFEININFCSALFLGHMRIGLTQLDPNSGFELPLYALPDLVQMGPCWLFAITKRHNNVLDHRYEGLPPGYEQEEHELVNNPREAPARADDDETSDDSDDGIDFENLRIGQRVFENNPRLLQVVNEAQHPVEDIEENAFNTDQQRKGGGRVLKSKGFRERIYDSLCSTSLVFE